MDRDEALSTLALAEEAEPELTGPRVAEWLDQLDAQHDRIGHALAWFLDHGESRQALRLGRPFGASGWSEATSPRDESGLSGR